MLNETLGLNHRFSNRLGSSIDIGSHRLKLRLHTDDLSGMEFGRGVPAGLQERFEGHHDSLELFPAALKIVILSVDVLKLVIGTFKSSEVV